MTEKGTHEGTGGFELFKPDFHSGHRGGHPGLWLPLVRLDKSAAWHISRPALQLLGHPKYVTLWYDAQKGQVGFKAAKEGDYAAYPVRSAGKKANQGVVTGRQFCKRYNIPHKQSKTYPARIEGELLIIDVVEHEKYRHD